MREAYALAFEGLGGVDALVRWGRRNPARFYPLAARLIPHDIARPLANLPKQVRVQLVAPVGDPAAPSIANGEKDSRDL
jgi:hypothetical protein